MTLTTTQLRSTTTFRGIPVSRAQRVILEAAERDGVHFTLNDARRTLAIQLERLRKHGPWSPSNPHGAAPARQSSPHLKYGNAHHADDVRWDDGGAKRLASYYIRQGVTVRFNVPSELWHMDPIDESQVLATARKLEDPHRGFPADERRWMDEYDHLKAHNLDLGRRRVLVRVMTERRKSIWRAAQQSGWDKLSRRKRYAALLARTK